MPMSKFFFKELKKPKMDPLSDSDIQSVMEFCQRAFGFSEWITRGGKKENYYFNVDKFYSHNDSQQTTNFHDKLVTFVEKVAGKFSDLLKDQKLVLAYLCQDGGPRGIVHARGVLSERLPYPSVLVYPNKMLLRARVVSDGNGENFPTSVQWLLDKPVLLLTDTATTGESIARAVGALRAFGCQPLAAVAVYDRDEGAAESLQTIKVDLYSVLDLKQIKEFPDLSDKFQTILPTKKIVSFAAIAAHSG